MTVDRSLRPIRDPAARERVGDALRIDAPPSPQDILVVGVPRSATTWVANVLAAGTGAYLWHEPDSPHTLAYAARAKRGLGRFPILERGDDAIALDALWAGVRRRERATSIRSEVARRVHARVWQQADEALGRAGLGDRATARVASMLASPPSAPDVSRIVAKSVHSSLCLSWLQARWSGPIVVAQRSPLAVVGSWRALGWAPPLSPDPAFRPGPALAQTLQRLRIRAEIPNPPRGDDFDRMVWELGVLAAVESADARSLPGVVRVRHEDLCVAPVQRYVALFGALGLTWTRDGSDFIAVHNRPGPVPRAFEVTRDAAREADKWRSILSAAEQRRARDCLANFPDLTDQLDEITTDR